MIYCGYQGCGKTTYCNTTPNCIDLDSSNFKKENGWFVKYVEIADALSQQGKKVFISAHQQVIEFLLLRGIEFEILAPKENKQAWRSRLEFRYHQHRTLPNLKAIADFDQNYDNDIAFYKECESQGIKVHWISAKIKTDLAERI